MTESSVREEAAIYAARTIYSLNNQLLTQDMKVEVESWYQLPIFVSRAAFAATCIVWAEGGVGAVGAYTIAAGSGVLVVILTRLVYTKSIVFFASMLLGFPWIISAVLLAIAAWLAINGNRVQGIALALNTILLGMPAAIPAIIAQSIVSGSSMHPKWAFAKRRFDIAP